MSSLTDMPNIVKALADCLKKVDITSPEELKKLGGKEAFLRLKLNDPDACINRLYALEGAVQGIRWHHLSGEAKTELKQFFNSL